MTQTYEAWRITYQSSEQAARAAFERMMELEQGKCLHQIAEPATAGTAVRAFRDYLGVHDGIKLGGQAMDDMALDLARIALDFKHLVEPRHPDDAAVDALAVLMKAKLAKQRAKGCGGWDTDCTQERLSDLLRTHVNKGDPVDVANFCAFLAARGEMICLTDAELINAMETRRAAEPQRLLAVTQPAPQAVQPVAPQLKANCYSDDNGDYWRDCPDDCDFVEGLKVGDTYELQASIRAWSETFRVTKAPDETSDDYEVELVSSDAPAHPAEGVPAPFSASGIAPCPLCGSASKHVKLCEDRGHRILCWNDDCECSSGYFSSKEDAIASWNSRAALAATQPAVPQEDAIAEIVSASHDAAEFGERGINFLRDFQHLEYGTKLYAHPAAPQAVQPAVPVGGQSRFKGEKDWQWCSAEHVAMVLATPSEWQGYEVHYVYAHPAEGVPAQAAQFVAGITANIDKLNGLHQERPWNLIQAEVLSEAIAALASIRELAATQPAAQGLEALTPAERDVIAERQRQISIEGWRPEHDDTHDEGEMCFAAAGYAALASDHMQAIVRGLDEHLTMTDDIPSPSTYLRPWPTSWDFKPCPPRRALVKAGALILAEIERVDRALAAQAKQGGA